MALPFVLGRYKIYCARIDFTGENTFQTMEVASFISEEIMPLGQMIGYRMMHIKHIQKGLTVKRETVLLLLSVLNQNAVAYR